MCSTAARLLPPLRFLTYCLAGLLVCQSLRAAAQENTQQGWVALFDGKTLNGWVQRGGKAEYAVVDGAIVGSSKPNTSNSFLCTDRDFADFVLEYEIKCSPELNSGVQIRSHEFDSDTEVDLENGKTMTIPRGRVHGYQVEFDANQADRVWAAGIYDEARRGWLFPGPKGGDPDAFAKQGRRLIKRDDWNAIRVEARGPSIKTYLNGELRTDMSDALTPSGFIGLQVHGVGDLEKPLQVSWRNLRIRLAAAQ